MELEKTAPGAKQPEALSAGLLVLATLLWGVSFPVSRHWQLATEACPGGLIVSSLTLMGLRLLVACILYLVFLPSLFRFGTGREFLVGCVLGALNFAGAFCQLLALGLISPAMSGFLTSLASAWVPPVAYFLFGSTVAWATLAGLVLGISGTAVLSWEGKIAWTWSGGEALTILASLVFAGVILLLDRAGKKFDSSRLSGGFVLMTGLPGLILAPVLAGVGPGFMAWLTWLVQVLKQRELVLDVVLLAFLCNFLAYYFMIAHQPRVSASRAALIYLLEPVFAAAFSLAWGYDRLSFHLVVGGAMILGGNLLVEIPTLLLARKQLATATS